MKEFTVRHVQRHLAEVLEAVECGEKVRIIRRGKVVAQLGPPEPSSSTLAWSDSAARLRRVQKLMNDEVSASAIIDEDRQERL